MDTNTRVLSKEDTDNSLHCGKTMLISLERPLPKPLIDLDTSSSHIGSFNEIHANSAITCSCQYL